MIVHDDLIRIALTDEILAKSAARAAATPVYRGSHRGATANQVEAIGGIITIQYLKETGVDFFEDFVTSHDTSMTDLLHQSKTSSRQIPYFYPKVRKLNN